MIVNNSSDCENNKSTTSDRLKEYIGNNKRYSIGENNRNIRIIGNGNKIYVETNSGTIEIIGNSTNLRILNNCGSVAFTGNNGTVLLGKDSAVKSIKFIGCNGTIKLVSKEELLVKKTTKLMSSPPLQTSQLSHDDCNNLFDSKFKKFSSNNLCINNVSMPPNMVRGLQIDLGSVIKIGQNNVVINRN